MQAFGLFCKPLYDATIYWPKGKKMQNVGTSLYHPLQGSRLQYEQWPLCTTFEGYSAAPKRHSKLSLIVRDGEEFDSALKGAQRGG